MIFNGVDYRRIYFIDIETVGCSSSYDTMTPELQKLWKIKAANLTKSEDSDAARLFEDRSGIYSEFGKIICISLGRVFMKDSDMHFSVKCFANRDEGELLKKFSDFLLSFDSKSVVFCGHNIKEFDIPYICRRMLVNGFSLPDCLNFSRKKPWEVETIDTMEMWSFGDKKAYTSLNLLTTIFSITSSKADIDGSQVHNVYYIENNLEKIAKYCSRDVVATAHLFFRLSGKDFINESNIEFAD